MGRRPPIRRQHGMMPRCFDLEMEGRSLPVEFERHREFVESGKFSMEFHQNFLILRHAGV